MPIYEYVCDACEETVEVLQKRTDPAPPCTSGDGGTLVRVLSAHSVSISGGGATPSAKERCDDCPGQGGCGGGAH